MIYVCHQCGKHADAAAEFAPYFCYQSYAAGSAQHAEQQMVEYRMSPEALAAFEKEAAWISKAQEERPGCLILWDGKVYALTETHYARTCRDWSPRSEPGSRRIVVMAIKQGRAYLPPSAGKDCVSLACPAFGVAHRFAGLSEICACGMTRHKDSGTGEAASGFDSQQRAPGGVAPPEPVRPVCACGQTVWPDKPYSRADICADCMSYCADRRDIDARIASASAARPPQSEPGPWDWDCWSTPTGES